MGKKKNDNVPSKVHKLKAQLTRREERGASSKDEFFRTRESLRKTRSSLRELKSSKSAGRTGGETSAINKIARLNDNLLKITDEISEFLNSRDTDEIKERMLELEHGILSQMYRLQSMLSKRTSGSGTYDRSIFIYGQESIGGNGSFFEPPDYEFFSGF